MCYLPGSEGKGISDVLCGCADFVGKLPSPWYGSIDEIGTDKIFSNTGTALHTEAVSKRMRSLKGYRIRSFQESYW